MESFKVLLVDDEDQFVKILESRLKRKGLDVKSRTCPLEAIKLLKEEEFDVGVFDIMMNDMDGIELLERAKKLQPDLEVIILTGQGSIETAIESMRKGAYDYISKPANPNELELLLEKAAEKKRIQGDRENLVASIEIANNNKEIIGNSKPMENLKYIINKVADSHLPVLILGESGTGKDLVANALHYRSCRREKPFVPINAGAIPGELLESELFGHVKGAFTGAHQDKKGLVEIAHGGTLFLDEIGDMDPALQVKLLRFLDTGEFRPVGGTITKKSSVRIITATNKDLYEAILESNFREDLYYRLSVVTVLVPSLKERGDDILLLAEHFLEKAVGSKKKLSDETKRFLLSYDFPGNVRELINIIERGVLLSKGDLIYPEDLFPNNITEKKVSSKKLSLTEVEKDHIDYVLNLTNWNKPEAAELLEIGLRTLYRKIDLYDLEE